MIAHFFLYLVFAVDVPALLALSFAVPVIASANVLVRHRPGHSRRNNFFLSSAGEED